MSINWQTDKQCVLVTQERLFSHTYKKNEVLAHNMEEPLKYILWKKPVNKGHILLLHVYEMPRTGKFMRRKVNQWLLGAGNGGRTIAKRYGVSFWGNENEDYGNGWIHVTILKTTELIHIKWVKCMVCELYHNKTDFKKDYIWFYLYGILEKPNLTWKNFCADSPVQSNFGANTTLHMLKFTKLLS